MPRRRPKGFAKDGLNASAISDLDAALGDADIISCATISTSPLVKGAL